MQIKEAGYSDNDTFFKMLSDSLTCHYVHGKAMTNWKPHNEAEWRILPYNTIVTMGECDACYSVEIKDKGKIRIHRNSVFVIPAGEAFKFELKEPAYLGNAHISYTIFEHIEVLSFFTFPYLIEGAAALEIIKIVNELAACDEISKQEPMDFCNLIRMKQLAFDLLEQLARQVAIKPGTSRKLLDMNRMEAVINYINDHIAEGINRKDLAKLIHLSETRFHYVFKEIMGISPMNYVTAQRLQKAQKKLLLTDISISEIAESVGISNISYFSSLFKKKFHVSPLHYRQMERDSLFGQACFTKLLEGAKILDEIK